MNHMLSNAAFGLSAGTLKAWTVVTNICRTMLVDHTKPYQPELHYMRGPARNGVRSTPASVIRPCGGRADCELLQLRSPAANRGHLRKLVQKSCRLFLRSGRRSLLKADRSLKRLPQSRIVDACDVVFEKRMLASDH